MFKIYNQNLERFTRNGCSIYTLYHICQIQWGIKSNNEWIISTLEEAENNKAWYETWGAYFWKIYTWFGGWFKKKTWHSIEIEKVDIMSDRFEDLLEQGYAFGLWLKYAWRWYRNAREDWVITKDETRLKWEHVEYWHNDTYFFSTKWTGHIIDSLGTVRNVIDMEIEILREAVKEWIYYPIARTLVMKDRRIDKWLRFLRSKRVTNDAVRNMTNIDLHSLERAHALKKAFSK